MSKNNFNYNQRGFTLVELSIVLIIIGFIIAGVAAGQSLVQQARLRAVIEEMNSMQVAVNSFVSRYQYLPGDFPKAADIWATAVNGNGDGHIGAGTGLDALGEGLQSFMHLSSAGLIPGNYTGADAGTPDFQPRVNLPGSKLTPNALYYLYYHNSSVGIFGTKTNYLTLAASDATAGPWTQGVITPSKAYSIDLKIDDGAASTGSLYVSRGNNYLGQAGRCVTADWTAASADYELADEIDSCLLWYKVR